MKTQILPNNFKIMGLSLFIFGFILSGVNSFMEGWHSIDKNFTGDLNMFSEKAENIFNTMLVVGMIVYMLSKEKIEDEYINKLRLESFQLSSLIFLLIALTAFLLPTQTKFSVDDFILVFLSTYLITFYIKKRIDL